MDINNSNSLRQIVGSRLEKARKDKGLKRSTLCSLLAADSSAPVSDLSPETLKQWELGKNKINIEWVPSIKNILGCDVGYLFGEYDCKTREINDAHEVTGLSHDAISQLKALSDSLSAGKENIMCDLAKDYLRFYSYFLTSFEINGLLLSYFGTLGRIEQHGLNEHQAVVFDHGKEEALSFYRFQAAQAILHVMERFFKEEE